MTDVTEQCLAGEVVYTGRPIDGYPRADKNIRIATSVYGLPEAPLNIVPGSVETSANLEFIGIDLTLCHALHISDRARSQLPFQNRAVLIRRQKVIDFFIRRHQTDRVIMNVPVQAEYVAADIFRGALRTLLHTANTNRRQQVIELLQQ